MNEVRTALPGKTGVLLIHGLTGTPTEMKYLKKKVSKAGFVAEAPTLAGHGTTIEELLKCRWTDWVESVQENFNKLQETCDKTFIVGLCASSGLAIIVAARDPRVAGIILISTQYGKFSKHMPWTNYLLPIAYPFPYLRRRFYWTETPPYGIKDPVMQNLITASLEAAKNDESADHGTFRTYVQTIYESELVYKEAKKSAPKVKCPALIMHSLEDSWFAPENALRAARDLGSAEKKVIMLSGCDHVLSVDLKKSEIASQIIDFVGGTVVSTSEPDPDWSYDDV